MDRQWVRATWLGWGLGLLLTIAAALAGEAVGIGGWQTPIGVGMGAGVGIMQARSLRGVLASSRRWVWSCIVGLATPFVAYDVGRAAGAPLPYSLYANVALGGLVAGLWQAILLRPHVRPAWAWVLASIAGWSAAAASAALGDYLPRALSIRGLAGAGMYLAATLIAGLVLAVVTAGALVRLKLR